MRAQAAIFRRAQPPDQSKEIAMKRLRALALVSILAFIAGCGGGGGGSVASTETFPFRQGYIAYLTSSLSLPFSISGVTEGFAVTGSGTFTEAALSQSTFEGAQALARFGAATGNFVAGGFTVPVAVVGSEYYDANYRYLGSDTDDEYEVVVSGGDLPTTVRVNDTGPYYVSNRYSSSSKAVLLGTTTASYVVEPDTANTALFKIIAVSRDRFGSLEDTTITEVRISADGSYRFLRISSTSDEGTLTFTF
jgi:hypothetical protein